MKSLIQPETAIMLLELGHEIYFDSTRIYIEVTDGQLNASCPGFITEEAGSLKTHVWHEAVGDRKFIMVNGTKKVNGVLVGDPDWQSVGDIIAVMNDKVHEYAKHYGYAKLLFEEQLLELKKLTEGSI